MAVTGRQWIFLLACLAFTAWLRFDFYPGTYYGDEEIPLAVVAQMEKNHSLDTNWKLGIWRQPANRWAYSYDQYNFSSYNSALYYLHRVADGVAHDVDPAVFNRVTSVIFQLITLALVFLFTQYLFGATTAVSAALFFSVNPLLVVDAHYARPESFLVLITTLAIALHLLAVKQQKNALLLIVAFLWGIACACKFSLLPMAFLALVITGFKQKHYVIAFISIPVFVLGAFVLAPYLFLRTDITLHGVQALVDQYLGGTSPADMHFTRSDLLLPKYLFIWFGVLTWPVMMAALFNKDDWQRRLAWLGSAVSVAYIAVFSVTSFFNESNLSHLAFAWCLLFALGIDTLLARTASPASRIAFSLLLALTLALPAFFSVLIRTEVFDAASRANLDAKAAEYEQRIGAKCPGSEAITFSQILAYIDSGNPPTLIRLGWMARNEYVVLDKQLHERNYQLIGEFRFPLYSLPHSQLQAIHFPASYRYYCLEAGR